MPQIQELMGNPSFGSQIGRALGSGLGAGIGQGISQSIEGFQRQKQGRAALEGIKPLLKQAEFDISPEDEEAFVKSGLDPSILTNFATNLYSQKQKKKKEEQDQAEQAKKQEGLQTTFNELSQMVKENAPGIGISPGTKLGINRQGVQNRNRFNTLRTRIEGALIPLVNKGSLSKERFKFILDNIPKASDSQRSIVGKLQGLATALSEDGVPIDTSILGEIDFNKDEPSQVAEKSEFPIAINPKTGQKLILKDGKWQNLR